MLLRNVAQRIHHEHVVVAGKVQLLELRRKLELRGRDLVVTRLRRDAELPQLLLHVVHEIEDPLRDRAEIVVFKLLSLCGRSAEERTAGHHQVRTLLPVLLVHEEVFLLRAKRASDVRLRTAEELHEPLHGTVQGLYRTQQRRLLVERLAGVRAKRRGDAERRAIAVPLDERGRGGIPRRVAARLEGRADAAGREGRRIRLADNQILSGERHYRLAVLYLEEGIVLLGGRAGHRKKPVRVMRSPAIHGPVLHRVRNFTCDLRIKRRSLLNGALKLLRRLLRQILLYRLCAKHVGAVARNTFCLFHQFVPFVLPSRPSKWRNVGIIASSMPINHPPKYRVKSFHPM